MALIERLPAAEPTAEPDPRLRVAVIGYGYWGPNLARNIADRAAANRPLWATSPGSRT